MRYDCTSLLAIVLAVALPAAANAEIDFCNKTEHPVFAAVAYQEADGSYTSTGWLEVKPGKCEPFDLPRLVSSFYYRGETDWYDTGGGNKEMATWGSGDGKFAVTDDDFTFANADREQKGARLESFPPASRAARATFRRP
jgi:uncharacterized membrane protein